MRIKIISLVKYSFLLVILNACKKELPAPSHNYIGKWESENYDRFSLEIDSQFNGNLIYVYGEHDAEVTGKVGVEGPLMKIGSRKFKVVKPPTKIDYSSGRDTVYVLPVEDRNGFTKSYVATWEMELEGISKFYFNGRGIFYR